MNWYFLLNANSKQTLCFLRNTTGKNNIWWSEEQLLCLIQGLLEPFLTFASFCMESVFSRQSTDFKVAHIGLVKRDAGRGGSTAKVQEARWGEEGEKYLSCFSFWKNHDKRNRERGRACPTLAEFQPRIGPHYFCFEKIKTSLQVICRLKKATR